MGRIIIDEARVIKNDKRLKTHNRVFVTEIGVLAFREFKVSDKATTFE